MIDVGLSVKMCFWAWLFGHPFHIPNQSLIMAKVTKGAWRMPWLTEAMKDVTSCDKPRLGAHSL